MISVCIATYNGEKYIKRQLISILSQLGPSDEVIISDDNSKDNTLKVILELKDSRIHIIQNQQNTHNLNKINKVTSNFENAIKYSNGEYIFLSDQDDIWLPDKIEKSMSMLKCYDMVVSDGKVINEKGNVIKNSLLENSHKRNKYLTLFLRTPYPGCCMAFNRKILNIALPFPKNIQSHDRWLGYVGRFFFSFHFIEEPLILNCRHSSNCSTMTSKSTNSLKYRIIERLRYIKYLFRLFTNR